jgi:hypothetical protein
MGERRMNSKKRKRYAIQDGAVDILAGEDPMSLQSLTVNLQETIRPARGVWKITPQMVAQALKGHPRVHKYLDNKGLSVYYCD